MQTDFTRDELTDVHRRYASIKSQAGDISGGEARTWTTEHATAPATLDMAGVGGAMSALHPASEAQQMLDRHDIATLRLMLATVRRPVS